MVQTRSMIAYWRDLKSERARLRWASLAKTIISGRWRSMLPNEIFTHILESNQEEPVSKRAPALESDDIDIYKDIDETYNTTDPDTELLAYKNKSVKAIDII